MYSYNTTAGTQIFYKWTGADGFNTAAEKWLMEENQFDTDFPPVPHNPGGSLAVYIVKEIFKLPLANEGSNVGGYLPGYDVQNREPYQMIQLSLATALTNNQFIECYMNEHGKVDFYFIGEDGANISSDVLYSTDGANYSQKCENVIIEGYDPPLKKFTRGNYDLFEMAHTYFSIEMKQSGDPRYDPILDGKAPATDPQRTYPLKYCLGEMMDVEACKYYQEGYIVYGDPGLTDPDKISGKGKIYNHKEFEEILEWIYDVDIPWFKHSSTEVTFEARSPYYHQIKNFGKLFNRQWTPAGQYVSPLCQSWQEVNTSDPYLGISLPMSECARFNGVKEVILYGFNIKVLQLDETYDLATGNIKPGKYDFVVDIDTLAHEPIRLVEGEDYVVVKRSDGSGIYKIIFLCSLNPNIRAKFDGVPLGTDQVERLPNIRVTQSCVGGALPGSPPECPEGTTLTSWWDPVQCEGLLRDGVTRVAVGSNDTFKEVIIFPTGEGTTGYGMLKNKGKIFVVYDWETPCVHFKDFDNQVTGDNLALVSIKLHPIIQKDLPRPIAICHKGATEMLDARQTFPDHSYGSSENLATSKYQQAMDALENGDIHLILPFIACAGDSWLACDELKNAASFIYSLQKQIINTTTYVCKPNASPVLGSITKSNGGHKQVINSIDYSYQDSSQYFITVNAGPIWQGFGGWDQSIYQNKTERVQVEGIVREVHWSNSRASVWLERIGMLECVNATPDMLEMGDVVKVTLYNNPISI